MIVDIRPVTREATDEEKARLLEIWQDSIDGLEAKAAQCLAADKPDPVKAANYRARAKAISDRIQNWTITENVQTYREPTADEKAQSQRDQAKAAQRRQAAEEARAERIRIMRNAAAAMKLSHTEYLTAFPSDVRLEELDGE